MTDEMKKLCPVCGRPADKPRNLGKPNVCPDRCHGTNRLVSDKSFRGNDDKSPRGSKALPPGRSQSNERRNTRRQLP